jgi:hypothetical protein
MVETVLLNYRRLQKAFTNVEEYFLSEYFGVKSTGWRIGVTIPDYQTSERRSGEERRHKERRVGERRTAERRVRRLRKLGLRLIRELAGNGLRLMVSRSGRDRRENDRRQGNRRKRQRRKNQP